MLSPWLFNVFMDRIMMEVKEELLSCDESGNEEVGMNIHTLGEDNSTNGE